MIQNQLTRFPGKQLRTVVLACALALTNAIPPETHGQGCVPIRHLSLSLGAEGIRYLDAHEWDFSISYRFLHSRRVFIEDSEQPQLQNPNGPRLDINSIDAAISYSWIPRLTTTLTIPFTQAHVSSVRDHADGRRHSTSASGLGDVRLVQNVWLFDPQTHRDGNISLGLGVKVPSGDDAAADKYYTSSGVEYRPVDISILPGDGGWGAMLELQAFQRIRNNLFAYGSGFYLLNPREQTDVPSRTPIAPHGVFNSVPDQYMARLGVSWTVWPAQGLALTLGPRLDGMPAHDAIGGSNGFRRPGYAVYVEPGLNLTQGNLNFGINCPVTVYRFRSQSVPEHEAHIHGAGGMADFLIMANATWHF